MSIKSLWDQNKEGSLGLKPAQGKNFEELFYEAESPEYVTQYKNSVDLSLQDVNFATASNFAKFGSARKYYENITTRIIEQYPYDGSKAQQLEFENSLNPYEKYIYLYQYPRSTGFVNFSPNGWGTQVASTGVGGYGLSSNPQYITFFNENENNIYDPDNGLIENTRFIFSTGSTIEFWMKKNGFPNPLTQTGREIIFYCTSLNEDKVFNLSLSTFNLYKSTIFCDYLVAGNSEFSFSYDTNLTTIADSNWHHYAFTFYYESGSYKTEFYLDGNYKSTQNFASATATNMRSSMKLSIGAFAGTDGNSTTDYTGYASLSSASIDEFRFWNSKRDAKQIGLNYFTNVGGGNDIINNTKLGVYFKFNEGILGTSSVDSIILDYAGRNCNGLFKNYLSYNRSTGSAITSTQEKAETGVPILYQTHPEVQTFLTNNLFYADEHDYKNNFSLINSLPSWIINEDAENGEILTNFLQTISSYLDTLHLQISTYKNIKNKDYLNYKGKAPPFSNLLLTSHGFDVPGLFLNLDIINSLLNQDNKKEYNEKITDLKNVIYKNIYNNLNIIYKSKGTSNSINQLIRNFGVNQDVFSLNIYANNTTYKFQDNYVNRSLKKSYVDLTPFTNNQNSKAVIYQSGSDSFISGTNNNSLAFTAECDVIIPQFPVNYDYLAYQTYTYNTASIFGLRTAKNTNSDFSVPTDDPAGLKVRLIYRDDKGYFSLSYPSASITLNSQVFVDLLKDQHWNISVRLKPISTGSSFDLYFSGYSNFTGDQLRAFNLTSSLSTAQGNEILKNNKRLYLGAERNNITGTLQYPSLVRGLSARYWSDYLENTELIEHAKNPNNFGRLNPSNNYFFSPNYTPKIETLLLNWDFSLVSSSNYNGDIPIIYDIITGAYGHTRYSNYPLNNLIGKIYNGAGYGFEPNTTVGGKELVYSSEQQIPENLYSDQLVNILSTDDDYYTTAIRPQHYFFSLENSMYDTISKNMLNMFATIVQFNNFIGEPLYQYKLHYSKLKFFRKFFFDKVGNQPDLDKYIGIYKWIDDALDSVLYNLLPASANASEKVRAIVEDHVLERNKIKYPIVPEKKEFRLRVRTEPKDPVLVPKIRIVPTSDMEVEPKIRYWISFFPPRNKGKREYIPPIGIGQRFYDQESTIGSAETSQELGNIQQRTVASSIKRTR